ncbi:MAG TPA: GNAT family N-acetyltransferase [Symbiobacteriaceae bacterium]
MFNLRTFDVARDCEGYAAIRAVCLPHDTTAEDVRAHFAIARAESDAVFERFVAEAEDEAGLVVGAVTSFHRYWLPEGMFEVDVVVLPSHRGRSLGSRLYEAGVQFAREHGATGLEAYCRGDDDYSNQWTLHRGFHLDRQRTESLLDLATWDPSPFAGHLEKVTAGGIRLVLLPRAEAQAYVASLYELDRETTPDVPGFDGSFPAYESWLREWQSDPHPKLFALALDGDRVVGMSIVRLPRQPGMKAGTEYTGVLRAYRGRGIALAVKLLTVEAAVRAGASVMLTNNDPDNPPMLRVNEKLGYRLVPGPRRYRQTLV